MAVKVTELGCAGHYIMAPRSADALFPGCMYRRHTQIGDSYRVSTVGDMLLNDKRTPIGINPDDFFETLVFRTTPRECEGVGGCGCHEIEDWAEIDGGRWATAGDAQQEHERLVRKYTRLTEEEEKNDAKM